jgi:hypothetical protein
MSARTAAALLLPTSAFLALLALAFAIHEYHLDSKSAHATATVVSLDAERVADGTIRYFPQFRFKTGSGEVTLARGRKGANPADYTAGQSLRIAYNATSPHEAMAAKTWDVYAVSIILGVLGVIVFDLGFLSQWIARRQAKRNARSAGNQRLDRIAKRNHSIRAANFWGGGRPSDPS